MADSSFEVVTPQKSNKMGKKGIIVAVSVVLFLFLAIFIGVLLVRQNQNVSEKAEGQNANSCPASQQCPSLDKKHLLNCTPPEADNSPQDSLCSTNQKGRIESCGSGTFCCNGTIWVKDMADCSGSPSPTATVTATATATATVSPTISPTVKASATPKATNKPAATPTKAPVPVTGTDWPTYAGLGVGIFVIVGSILLAL